ncbi:MAG: DUF4468 domain-containing protein [Cytophagales bacterium]
MQFSSILRRQINHLIFILFFTSVCEAQLSVSFRKQSKETVKFQKDENGKIIFYEVVICDSVPRDTLWKNGLNWVKNALNDKKDNILFDNQLFGTIEAETSLMLYVPSIITKMPHGRLTYKIILDIKDRKYRYTFTDFIFQYYQQDRKDFQYKPVKGSYRPFEKEKYPGYQTAWNNHKLTVKEHIGKQISNLKSEIVKFNTPIADTAEKTVIKSKDW